MPALVATYRMINGRLVRVEKRRQRKATRPLDSQRGRVYGAEQAMMGHLTVNAYDELPVIQAWHDLTTKSKWWKTRFGIRKITARIKRCPANAVSPTSHAEVTNLVAAYTPSMCDEVTFAHEVAHIAHHWLCSRWDTRGKNPVLDPWHGPIFARIFLEVVEERISRAHAESLRLNFEALGVKVHPWTTALLVAHTKREVLAAWKQYIA